MQRCSDSDAGSSSPRGGAPAPDEDAAELGIGHGLARILLDCTLEPLPGVVEPTAGEVQHAHEMGRIACRRIAVENGLQDAFRLGEMRRGIGRIELDRHQHVIGRKSDRGARVVGIALQRFGKMRLRLGQRRQSGSGIEQRRPAAEDQRVNIRAGACACTLGARHLDRQLTAKTDDDLVLEQETVGAGAAETGGPHALRADRIDQLDRDIERAVVRRDRCGQRVSDTQLLADRRRIRTRARVAARGLARDDTEHGGTRQRVAEVVGHHVGDQLRRLIRAGGSERKNDDRNDALLQCARLARLRARPLRGRLPVVHRPVEREAQALVQARALATAELLQQRVGGQVRLQRNVLSDAVARLVEPPGERMSGGEAGPWPWVARLQRGGAAEALDRVRRAIELELGIAGHVEKHRHGRIARAEPHRVADLLESLRRMAGPRQMQADVGVRRREARIELDRALEILDRLRSCRPEIERKPEVEICRARLWIAPQRLLQDCLRLGAMGGVDPLQHFNTFGWHEGRDPNALFDSSGYLAVYKDVAAAGINPLDHYHQSGWHEGRDPSGSFDTLLYLIHNPDVAAIGMDPLAHYLAFGQAEGRAIYPGVGPVAGDFDAQYYVWHNPDVTAAGVDPLQHYNLFGWHEGRNPNAWFDSAGYLSHYADVAAAGVDPLAHYRLFGWHEGRDPSAGFDTLGYLAANPDVAAAGVDPLAHYLQFGIYEGRAVVNDGTWH